MQTFSYSGMQGNRTIFTIRASRATEFKAGSPALLEDVWISIYGSKGERNDSIHTRECSYEQKTGGVQCAGEVTIDIRPAQPQAGAAGQESMHLTTSNLTFDGQTGEAQTPAAVTFALPQGQGSGVGVTYQTRAAIVRVEHAVKFEMAPTTRSGGRPVSIQAASLEVRRNDRKVLLAGPVLVQQGERELSAGEVTVSLGEKLHARQVLAEDPSIRIARGAEVLRASARTLEANLSDEGWIEHITASGNVSATRESPKGTSRFSSERAEFAMAPARDVLRRMTATGGVSAESQQGGSSQTLKAPALRLNFAVAQQADKQHIEQAETVGVSTIGLKDARETTELTAPKFTAQFSQAGRMERLMGGTGVDVRRTSSTSQPQTSTAQQLNATFARDGQWNTVEEMGDVTFQQGDRHATAQHARIDRASGEVRLSGAPVIEDAVSRTTANTVALAQKSGAFTAQGDVATTYFPAKRDNSGKAGTSPAHITAEKLSGSTTAGQVTYSGHARLWQGESVLQGDQIAIGRDQKKLAATGNVVAVFAQIAGANLVPTSESKKTGPTLWQARAPELTYLGDAGQVHMAGGVRIASGDVSLASRTLDLELGTAKGSAAADASPLAKGELTRAIALGNVVVRQGGLQASAEQAIYTAREGKFVLSGGKPTITDASGNSASGRSLTFFLPNDTILIDSQEGSRTLTKYRVEK